MGAKRIPRVVCEGILCDLPTPSYIQQLLLLKIRVECLLEHTTPWYENRMKICSKGKSIIVNWFFLISGRYLLTKKSKVSDQLFFQYWSIFIIIPAGMTDREPIRVVSIMKKHFKCFELPVRKKQQLATLAITRPNLWILT